MNLSYLFLEASVLALFVATCLHARRRGHFLEVATAALYGLLLEEGDILIFRTYHYSSDFILRIDRVPIAIALAWAIIVYTCTHISDAYGISRRVAPFADALWAIVLDLAFDAVAIRLGLWTWVIPLDAGFFGVPAGNFYAWLFVAFSFSLFTRLVRAQCTLSGVPKFWQLGVPLAAYALLLLSMLPFFALRNAFFPETGGGLPVFWTVLAVFAVLVGREMLRRDRSSTMPFDWLPVLLRGSFHGYFLAALLLNGLFVSVPALLFVALAMAVVELVVLALVWRRSRST